MVYVKDVSVFDEDIDSVSPSDLHLSIQFSFDRFSYAIMHIKFRKYLCLSSYSLRGFNGINSEYIVKESIRDIYENEEILRADYHSVSISYFCSSSDFFIIPSSIYDKDKISIYLSLLTNKDKLRFVENIMDSIGVVGLEYKYLQIEKLFLGIYGDRLNIFHSSRVFLNNLGKNKYQQGVFVNISASNTMEVLILGKRQEIEFYNSLNIYSHEDVIMFLEVLFKEYRIGSEAFIYLSGNVNKECKLYGYLQKYYRNTLFVGFDKDYLYSLKFENFPYHNFFTLLSQY